ncbi:hypothetical protein TNCV_4395691 [Trichonephila clavipes]|uniref:Uncharacterized protein n=1 Tax=Trichonephila clavipes TaxID=2585209 RepID=A0A8X6W4N8_TRICX|nr:hypothetical protein TNCV_4395691 [Trichonephila clavipes]
MTHRNGLSPDEIANLLRELSENESGGGPAAKQRADVIDNIPVNSERYVATDGTDWIPHNSNVPGIFATRNVLQQSIGPTSFAKLNVNVIFL